MFQNTAHIKKITYIHSVGYADSAHIGLRSCNSIVILWAACKVVIPHQLLISFEHLRRPMVARWPTPVNQARSTIIGWSCLEVQMTPRLPSINSARQRISELCKRDSVDVSGLSNAGFHGVCAMCARFFGNRHWGVGPSSHVRLLSNGVKKISKVFWWFLFYTIFCSSLLNYTCIFIFQ